MVAGGMHKGSMVVKIDKDYLRKQGLNVKGRIFRKKKGKYRHFLGSSL